MKTLMTILLLGITALTAEAGDWKLVWSDEFGRPGLPDPAKWDYETGFIRNNEKQFYTLARKQNARVENGILIIEARKEKHTNPSAGRAASSKTQGAGEARSRGCRVHGGQSDDSWQGRLDLRADGGARQAPLRPRDLACDLVAGDKYWRRWMARVR